MNDISSAWKLDTPDPIIQRALMHEFPLPEGQEFVWQKFFNARAKVVRRQHWYRRHIRLQGSTRTLCRMDGVGGYDWKSEPTAPCVVDDCAECRGMSTWKWQRTISVAHE